MKKLQNYFILIVSLFYITTIQGQSQGFSCDFDTKMTEQYKIQKEYLQSVKTQDLFRKKYISTEFIPNRGKSNHIKKIPIVFHVIHNFGWENISDATILAQLKRMNDHWRKKDPDTVQIASPFDIIHDDMEIEFVLAKKDPQGNCSNGITRTVSPLTDGGGDAVKGLIRWPNNQYLNVWIVRNTGNGSGGYSYLPGVSNGIDGIVILSQQLSALAHEAGHWLGLPHTWGGTNNSNLNSNCNTDDNITDTPNTQGQGGCNTGRNSCSGSPIPFLDIFGGVIWPANNGEIHDNVQNYMDYGFCSAENFTQGQKAICQGTLINSVNGRNNLWTDSNLVATGTNDGFSCQSIPIPDFDVLYNYACSGSPVSFINNSYNSNNISNSWSFSGGSPSTSSSQNPSCIWNTPGEYDVTLTVSNSAGSNSLTKTSIVRIFRDNPFFKSPFFESFEDFSFPNISSNPDKNWIIETHPSSPSSWKISSNASTIGSSSISIDCKNIVSINSIITPTFDFSESTCTNITFDVSYARRANSTNDILKVYTSTNCGKSWTATSYEKSGADLETSGFVISGDFIPTNSEWRSETIGLPQHENTNKLQLKFELQSGNGNYLYIDNLNVGCSLFSIDEEYYDFRLLPNPSITGVFNLNNLYKTKGQLKIEVIDTFGKQVYENLTEVSNQYRLDLSNNPQGVYFVKITSENKAVIVKKVVIQK